MNKSLEDFSNPSNLLINVVKQNIKIQYILSKVNVMCSHLQLYFGPTDFALLK